MIYLKTGIGIELRGEDMLLSSLQSNFSRGTFTHFKRITDYRLRDKEDLRREVNYFFRGNGLSKDSVVLGIPRKDIVLRYLDLPLEVKDNLKQVVQYQVQSFEPTEEDRFYHDYALLNGQAGQKRLSILLVMVRKSLLDGHLRLLRDLEIRPMLVTGSSMGLANLYLQGQNDGLDKTFLIADLGNSGLELLALRNRQFIYSRETSKGESQNWRDLLLNEVNEAVSKLRLNPEGTLEKIILAGESSESAHEEIKTRIPDCELLNKSLPFAVPGENKVYLQEAACTLGLALTGIAHQPALQVNLLPPELRSRQTRLAYITAAVLSIVILVLLAGLGIRQTVQNRMLLSELEKETKALHPSVQRVLALRTRGASLEDQIKLVQDLLRNKDRNLEILHELTVLLPPDTFLQSYSNRDGSIQLVGLSGSSSDLIPKLEKSALLKDVVQKGVIYKDSQTGKDRFTFDAKLEK